MLHTRNGTFLPMCNVTARQNGVGHYAQRRRIDTQIQVISTLKCSLQRICVIKLMYD